VQIDYGTVAVGAGERYRVRFRVHQSGPFETILRAKLWAEVDAEPSTWTIAYTNANPVLQNRSGGFAFENWSDYTDPNDMASLPFRGRIDRVVAEFRRERQHDEGSGLRADVDARNVEARDDASARCDSHVGFALHPFEDLARGRSQSDHVSDSRDCFVVRVRHAGADLRCAAIGNDTRGLREQRTAACRLR